jgi:hypothetical protein
MSDTYAMHVTVRRDTPKALLVERHDTGRFEQHWVPRSQIRSSEVCYRGDTGLIEVTRRWAQKAGLLDDDQDSYHESETHSQRGATPAVIELTQATRVYRQLALEHHPDRAGGDGRTMKALNILMDAVKSDIERAASSR